MSKLNKLREDYTPLNEGRTKGETTIPKLETKPAIKTGTRKVQVNKNTWIYTGKSEEQAIKDFNNKYN